jgi:hypothetical protein
MRRRLGCLLAGLAALGGGVGATPLLAPLEDADAWRLVLLPQQKLPATRFSRVQIDGRRALRIEAVGSYGNLVLDLPVAAADPRTLSWQWRVDRPVAAADLRQRRGDDAAAKICVMYDMPLDRVPFLERQALRLASAAAGEALPTATVCYVWDARLAAGTVLPNAFSRRMRWIVLRGDDTELGRWQSEQRDLAADFRLAFGDESPTRPRVAAVLVGADTDNTGGHSLAHVAGLELTR